VRWTPWRTAWPFDMPILALAEALAVVVLWSASPILVKLLLPYLSPTELAGARYLVAGLCLAPLVWVRSRGLLASLGGAVWLRLALMGVLAYTIGNSLFFTGLKTLPATTSVYLLNIIPLATLVMGALWLKESPRPWQWLGVVLAISGGLIFFGGGRAQAGWGEPGALAAGTLGGLALAAFGILGRSLARRQTVDSISLSALPMVMGGGLLVLFDPPPLRLPASAWLNLAWLTLVNSALAYILWNHALQRLQAFEISLVSNLMPMGTALLAPSLLAETVAGRMWAGMGVSLIGVVMVGLAGGRKVAAPASEQAIIVRPAGGGDPPIGDRPG
jgi:drug/metabolite transporter (DMT)-like permease